MEGLQGMAARKGKKNATPAAGKGRGGRRLVQANAAGAGAYFQRGKGETLDQVLARCPHAAGELRRAWQEGAREERRRLDQANKNWPDALGDRPFVRMKVVEP